jgi:lipopolysaccharide biosynthesis protein
MKTNAREVPEIPLIWRIIPLNRPQKETLKRILFGGFSFLFNGLPQYHQWKASRVFSEPLSMPWQPIFWEKIRTNRYLITLAAVPTPPPTTGSDNRLAVVIHAFYPDILLELLERLEASRPPALKLFITCPISEQPAVEQLLQQFSFEYFILVVDNRGRDILPFIKILPQIVKEDFPLLLKLHTKRSNYRNRKALWKDDLFDKLVGSEQLFNSIRVLEVFPSIGILGPENHVVPMGLYYGANAEGVKRLSHQLGLKDAQLLQLNFVAGSMFYARTAAMLPLLTLSWKDTDFEEEAGQVDGTLAHAVERAFSSSARAAGMLLADTSSTPTKPRCTVNLEHFFTQ